MPSNQRRELTWHQRFILLLGLAVLLISLIGVLSLVPATSAIRQQGQMLRLRFKLQSIDASSEALPRMPIEELIRFLPQLPRIDQSAIPKLIHQSYKNTTLPADFQTYRKSWSLYHPTWLYQFWTDEVGCGPCLQAPLAMMPSSQWPQWQQRNLLRTLPSLMVPSQAQLPLMAHHSNLNLVSTACLNTAKRTCSTLQLCACTGHRLDVSWQQLHLRHTHHASGLPCTALHLTPSAPSGPTYASLPSL